MDSSPSPKLAYSTVLPTHSLINPHDPANVRWGAGGDASVAELESAGTRDPKWLIDRANVFLQAGAHVCRRIDRSHHAEALTKLDFLR